MKPTRFPMHAVAGSDTLGQAHLVDCDASRGRWFAVRCAAESVHSFVAPRMLTTAFVVAAIVGAVSLAL